jgi:hypothetical protein
LERRKKAEKGRMTGRKKQKEGKIQETKNAHHTNKDFQSK